MELFSQIKSHVATYIKDSYGVDVDLEKLSISETKKEFEGDYTLVVFPLVKIMKSNPESCGAAIGDALAELPFIEGYNVIKGFLNLQLNNAYWLKQLPIFQENEIKVRVEERRKKIVEFSSPNTNKPLHLGHLRNIFLGDATARILDAYGHEVTRVQIVNDRGIAICKSMVAWQKCADGGTPKSESKKGDHFVGEYYVKFEQKFVQEYLEWQKSEEAASVLSQQKPSDQSDENFFKKYKNEFFNHYSSWGGAAKEMLVKWEQGDEGVIELWRQMNQWVYDGFNATYKALGVEFDQLYYESNTYLKGKDLVLEGLEKDLFYNKEDGSVWVDLEDAGMDQKIVLRADGTSVYLTQDLGTAELRYTDHEPDDMIYVVADEQDYHFQVLFEVMKRLVRPYADGLYHLSYGMVDLPQGRMKSREGTVVDADDLLAEVIQDAELTAAERGELSDVSDDEKSKVIIQIALAALKFYILRVQPRKRMTYNPEDSMDMQGDTGPYILNAYVRIQSLLRKNADKDEIGDYKEYNINESERSILRYLAHYGETLQLAADNYDPSIMAQYALALAKRYHKFYHDNRILTAESAAAKNFRVKLSITTGQYLKTSMNLLGITMPQRM